MGSTLRRLLDGPVRPGQVVWLGQRPQRRGSVRVVDALSLDPAAGIHGDHYAGRSGTRQVSLIGEDDLRAIGAFLGTGPADPRLLRRNVVTAGINLHALKHRRFRLGGAVLTYTGDCHPCSRMEELLGPGGYNAVRGHGGILARVLEAGTVANGGALCRLEDDVEPATLRQ